MKKITTAFVLFSTLISFGADLTIPADDNRIQYTDCVNAVPENGTVSFNRLPLQHGRKYHLDNPGARMHFRCNAKDLSIELTYLQRDDPVRFANGTGVFRIDGKGSEEWTFTRADPNNRKVEAVQVKLPADGQMHDYELVMPYAERVSVNSVKCNEETEFKKPTDRPSLKCAFYGDSVTHGATASRIDRCYPFRIGEIKGWQIINLGLGGIAFNPSAAKQLAEIPMDKLIIALGVNDWQGGRKPEDVGNKAAALIGDFRKAQPDIPITVITPLWVPSSWKPEKAAYDLALYREAIANAVKNGAWKKISIIDGDALIDHDPALFDKVAVHPNDKGFEQMAARIAEQL